MATRLSDGDMIIREIPMRICILLAALTALTACGVPFVPFI